MGVAKLSAMRSKDPATKVGVCIVNEKNIILSTGYNGMPRGCKDSVLPWGKTGSADCNKHYYLCHAEVNAILNCRQSNLENSKLFTTLFPCCECAKIIVQAGIKEVIFENEDDLNKQTIIAAKKIFELAKIKTSEYSKTARKIELNL